MLSSAAMPSTNITVKQANVIISIRNFQHLHGLQPTVRDLAKMLDIARGTVVQHLASLERKGLIRRQPKLARSIEILQAA